ncbi:hypothetical protein MTR67_000529 [Solanum verrucosum]|uniref:DUF4218 domain-containing protein n=1 Tax=Solanum verrucosum TaxID=315347 RepID=A0AAF0PSG5_SOLVR|nr:hypothetical protein MTR67_000529 [Solanum verrucosum]
MRASLMWTINDFLAYGMLSGWMTVGKLACPYCMENMTDVKGKTKDNPKARMDIKEYCRRKELWLQEVQNGKIVKPKASFSFTLDEKHEIIEWVKNLRMPEGYASNLGKWADMNEGKLIGMKTHDCHVFMETLIPIAFSHLPERIWKPITEISLFLKDLCSGKLLESSLDRMEENILVTTTKLEKIFPCGFFDVMEHLPIHLVQEARLGGSVQTRWMYPFERRNRPNRNDEGDIDPLFPPISIFNQNGRGSKKRRKRGFTDMKMQSAVTHILLNCPEIQSYVNLFVNTWGNEAIYTEIYKWLRNYVYDEYSSIQHLQLVKEVALGPESQVLAMNKYCVNSFKFQTEEVSRNKKTNNSGVHIQGDVDGTGQTIEYYGVIQEIIEVSKPVGRIEIDNVLDVAYQNDVAIVQQQVDVELETTLRHHQHILEEVFNDEILNVEEEISKNEENESFDDEEWDDNENETTEEEEWENDGIETSEEE